MERNDQELDLLLEPLAKMSVEDSLLERWAQAMKSHAQIERLSLRRRRWKYAAGLVAATVVGLVSGILVKDISSDRHSTQNVLPRFSADNSQENILSDSATIEFVYDKMD